MPLDYRRPCDPGGGPSDPIATGGEGMNQPNPGEGALCTFVTGTTSGLVPGMTVYATDGILKTLLVVDAIGTDEGGFTSVSFTNPIPIGTPAFGTTTFYAAGP
jgi:hypothetical protein